MHDIVVALEWIRGNIARFGGAPSGVTLFGQSSGSYAICNICVAPKAKGLFDKAVLHSGPCFGGPPGKGWGPGNATLATQVRTSIFKTLNVSTIAELRAIKNASSIQWPDHVMNDADAAPFFSGYFPDAFVIPTTTGLPRELWAKGAINPSALIVGHMSKDGTAGFYGIAPTLGTIPPDANQTSGHAYVAAQHAVWGEHMGDKVVAAYPLSEWGGSPQSAFIQSDADLYVICPAYALTVWAHAAKRPVSKQVRSGGWWQLFPSSPHSPALT